MGGKGVQAPGTSDPLGAGLQGALEDRAHCGRRPATAPNSAAVLLGFAGSALQLPIFLDSESCFSQTLASGAKNAARHGLRAAPGAITASTLITGDGSGRDWAPI